MEIKVVCRSKVKAGYINAISKFYAKELKLAGSRYRLTIYTIGGLEKRDGMRGAISLIGPRELAMALDSRLTVEGLTNTVAHEMVHAKQWAKGQVKQLQGRRGKTTYTWLGKEVDCGYYDAPWELEAFSREHLLVAKLARAINV